MGKPIGANTEPGTWALCGTPLHKRPDEAPLASVAFFLGMRTSHPLRSKRQVRGFPSATKHTRPHEDLHFVLGGPLSGLF